MKSLVALFRSFAELHPVEAAHTLEQLDPAESAEALDKLPASLVAPVIERMSPVPAAALLDRFSPERLCELLQGMSRRAAASILRMLDETRREAALAGFAEGDRLKLRELLSFPADTAGGIMDPQVASIPIDATVEEAISTIRKAKRGSLYYLYVIDREGRLVGVLTMRDLLLASPQDPIEPMVRRDVTTVQAGTDREEVAHQMHQRRLLALPVVDAESRLVGVVRHDQAAQTVRQEAFEDIQKMVGASGEERALAPVGMVVRKRLGWLFVNLVTAIVAGAVVVLFEGVVDRIVALAALLPIIAGQGGNTGAQALAVVIRGLALREIPSGAAGRVVWKELLGGTLNGLAIGAVTATIVFLWDGRGALAAVAGVAMLVNMAAAGFSGALIPIALKAMGYDPAQSSSIFMTTVTDVVGFAALLGLAALVMA